MPIYSIDPASRPTPLNWFQPGLPPQRLASDVEQPSPRPWDHDEQKAWAMSRFLRWVFKPKENVSGGDA